MASGAIIAMLFIRAWMFAISLLLCLDDEWERRNRTSISGPGREEFRPRSGRLEGTFGAADPLDRAPERGRIDGGEPVKERFDLFEMLHEPIPIDGTAADKGGLCLPFPVTPLRSH